MNCMSNNIIVVAVIVALFSIPVIGAVEYGAASEDVANNTEIQDAVQSKYDEISAEFNNTIGKEYGITYDEYCQLMSQLSGKAIVIESEGDVVDAKIVSSINAGRFGAEVSGHYLYIYLDSASVNLILSGGSAAVVVAITALLNSVAPALGAVIGGVGGSIIVAAIAGGLNSMIMEGLNIENGIVAVFQYMDSYNVFGMQFDFICNPIMISIYPQ